MTIYVTADLHFFHENKDKTSGILKFESMNKFRGDLYETIEEMNEDIIKKINREVGPSDTLIIVGDFCMGYKKTLAERLRKILPRINCKRIILVRGNHDPFSVDVVWEEFGHKVVDMYRVKMQDKQLVTFCHYPLASWEKGHYGSIMIHGHCHGKFQGQGRILDAGWDVYGKVMKLDDLVAIANQIPIVSIDGH